MSKRKDRDATSWEQYVKLHGPLPVGGWLPGERIQGRNTQKFDYLSKVLPEMKAAGACPVRNADGDFQGVSISELFCELPECTELVVAGDPPTKFARTLTSETGVINDWERSGAFDELVGASGANYGTDSQKLALGPFRIGETYFPGGPYDVQIDLDYCSARHVRTAEAKMASALAGNRTVSRRQAFFAHLAALERSKTDDRYAGCTLEAWFLLFHSITVAELHVFNTDFGKDVPHCNSVNGFVPIRSVRLERRRR
jgi:hypothetical protein